GARTKNLAEKIAALREKRGRYGAMLADLERTGESQISLTDPDSRAMAAHTKVGVGYNIQIAVDAKNKMIVEHPFGSIKQWMNQGAFLMRGLENVRAEFSLTALVYNMRRALNIIGVEAMMTAVRG